MTCYYTTLCYTIVYHITLHMTTIQYITLCYNILATLHHTTPHHTTAHYNSLHHLLFSQCIDDPISRGFHSFGKFHIFCCAYVQSDAQIMKAGWKNLITVTIGCHECGTRLHEKIRQHNYSTCLHTSVQCVFTYI